VSYQSTLSLYRDYKNIFDFVTIGVIKPSGSLNLVIVDSAIRLVTRRSDEIWEKL